MNSLYVSSFPQQNRGMADFVVPPSPQPFLSTPTGKFPVNNKKMPYDVKVSFEPSNAIVNALMSKLIDTFVN